MKKPPASKHADDFRPVKPSPGHLAQYRVQLLPTGLDIAKAIVIVVVLAVGLRIAPCCRELWTAYVQHHGRPRDSELASEASIAGTAHRATEQTELRTEGDTPRVGGRLETRPFITVHVEFTPAPNPEPAPSPESPVNTQFAKHAALLSLASMPNAYFDNAGKSYASKAARNAGEDDRLSESLRRFPAMPPEQRAILRQRAFARIEVLDMQQRIHPAP